MKKSTLEFLRFSKQWYWDAHKRAGTYDNITIGSYCEDGGCFWEFSIIEILLGNETTIQLKIFNDGLEGLKNPTLVKSLIGLKNCNTLDEVEEIFRANHIHEKINDKNPADELIEQTFKVTIKSETSIICEEIRSLINNNRFIRKISVES